MEVAAHLVSKGLRAVAINAASAYQALALQRLGGAT